MAKKTDNKPHKMSKSLRDRMQDEAKCMVEVKSLQTKLKEKFHKKTK